MLAQWNYDVVDFVLVLQVVGDWFGVEVVSEGVGVGDDWSIASTERSEVTVDVAGECL